MVRAQDNSGATLRDTGRRRRSRPGTCFRRDGYVLLETVIATGLLVLGIAVLGAQIQTADRASHEMDLKIRALMLAQMQLAHLDTGLIEIDSIDEEQEEDFGPRYQNFAWRLITEETATEELFRLTLEVLYLVREDYDEDFDFDEAEVLCKFYVFRAKPKPLNFAEDFGMKEEDLEQMAEKLEELGIDGLAPDSFDPSILAKLDSEELIEVLPVLADVFGIDISGMMASLPPDVLDALREQGLLDGLGGEGDSGEGGF